MNFKLVKDDCLNALKSMENNCIDALVTDPPAGISFMGKEWDSGENFIERMREIYKECLRVMKPGAHGLVWALPKTSHWTATALEQAGFEIRDVVTHLFGTGFPKSLDISKAIDKEAGANREIIGQRKSPYTSSGRNETESLGKHKVNVSSDGYEIHPITCPATELAKKYQGWGTALKPACEFWILVRKPISEKTVAKNVAVYGTGGLNIDECRIESTYTETELKRNFTGYGRPCENKSGWAFRGSEGTKPHAQGRFPANLVLDEEAAAMLGGASRFFYVAKASRSDRNEGLKESVSVENDVMTIDARKNHHPTVKSTKLMEYLIKLITPPSGIVLDPFMGSGSTGKAAKRLGFGFIGIEKEEEYFKIAEARCEL